MILYSYLGFIPLASGQPLQSFLSFLYSLGLSAHTAKLVVVGLTVLSVIVLAYLICWWILSGISHENIGKHPVQNRPRNVDGPYCDIKSHKEKKKRW